MRNVIITVLFILNVNGGSLFRFDYTYYESVGGWLKLHVMPAKFSDAFRMCNAEGTILASPLNEKLRNAINQLHRGAKLDTCAIYTGIHATLTKGSFSSIEGVPLSKIPTIWAPEEPDNYKDSEECIVMLQNGTMADVRCTETYPYVCYKKKTGEITLNECGTIDDGYKLDSRAGSCYKFHTNAHVWTRAYSICVAEGAYLAVINSKTEAEVLRQLQDKHPEDSLSTTNTLSTSIGFRDWSEHTLWLTVKGETLKEAGYDDWAPNEPNNIQYDEIGGENCGSILRRVTGGLLNDVPCNIPLAFICEMTPNYLKSPN